jgi:ribokinase
VAIKLGSDGSLVCGPDLEEPVHVPCVPVETVDPTGAGDAYCGAFGVAYGQTRNALAAALHGTVAGSLTVERRGALAVLPFDQVLAEQRLSWLRSMLREIEQPCVCKTAS